MALKLIKLTPAYREQLVDMIDEWRADQEKNHTNHSPWVIFKNDPRDFEKYLSELETPEDRYGLVADSVFFLLDDERDRLLGAVNIRHHLNERLLFDGGHVGDGIRPTERRKGFGTELIRLALLECGKLGIDRVLITCDRENIASAKAIVRNGGVLENEVVDEDGEVVQRYWVDL
ncbi:MAG: GNAT family N-acetyltransferase [Clostridia bacterium]|nr:GNAT family N-acetyltransferase [Clostridia bacterium]